MATERPLPIPPSPTRSPKFSFPSPMKHDPNLKPNPHPYAVKTTTSALLTRSNSSSHNVESTRHYYVPLSPNASRSPETGKSHKTSKSLSSVADSPTRSSPRPLPVPPGSHSADSSLDYIANGTNGFDDGSTPPRRNKRADTLPSYSSSPADVPQLLAPPDDLLANPKLWTPSQLSTYLVTALRVTNYSKSGDTEPVALPIRVAKDIAAFLKARMITGRQFLRLNEADLESMGMNKKWREALLIASHELRQNVLKGRIWGPETSPGQSPGSTSPLLMAPFSNSLYNSSSSSLELSADEGEADKDAPRPRRYRNGRVRGMVETFERSGSFSSEGSVDDEGADERSELGRWLRKAGPVEDQPLRSPSPVERRPVPESLLEKHIIMEDEEPSIEALIAAAEAADAQTTGTWGARAWEEMDLAPGVTVKRISDSEDRSEALEGETYRTVIGHGSGKSAGRKERDDRRVVTAIFAPAYANGSNHVAQEDTETHEKLEQGAQTELGVECQDAEVHADDLGHQLAITRALVEAFRTRLSIVEQKVMKLERMEIERERGVRLLLMDTDVEKKDAAAAGASSSTKPSRNTVALPLAVQKADGNASVGESVLPEAGEDDGNEPSSISELPSYVLLVGFGICAVVLRVVLRRVAGRGAIAALRS